MSGVTGVDLVSRVVHVQAGVRGGQLEDVLAGHGPTVGHYPQSIAASTVGGWIAASSAGQASTGFGAIEDALLGLTAVLPQGEILRCRAWSRPAVARVTARRPSGCGGAHQERRS
jgi:alkyldihydroxyacetonephosphate synthase